MIYIDTFVHEIGCGVPGCAVSYRIRNVDLVRIGQAFGGKHGPFREYMVRYHGWYHEKLHSKRTGNLLERDICPTHAPAYRALANATENATKEERAMVNG